MSDIVIGWDGTCAKHRGMPTVAHPASSTVTLKRASTPQESFCRVIEVKCALDHRYLAVDLDDEIFDPFTPADTQRILEESK